MTDWYDIPVIEEKIAGSQNHFRFSVGNDIIEMAVCFFDDPYFENLNIEILDHYISNPNNKPLNPNRTAELVRRIRLHLHNKYLEELKKVFKDIASQVASEKLTKSISCMGHTFLQGSTPKEIFSWFSRHYTSTCAAGDFFELVMQTKQTNGFLSQCIASYLNP